MTTLTQWELVAETKEWVGPLSVTVNTVPITTFQVCMVPVGSRPSGFLPADADPDGGSIAGILVGTGTSWPLTAGTTYMLFVKYTDSPEIPVEKAGRIKAV